jgi:hypothetical protein
MATYNVPDDAVVLILHKGHSAGQPYQLPKLDIFVGNKPVELVSHISFHGVFDESGTPTTKVTVEFVGDLRPELMTPELKAKLLEQAQLLASARFPVQASWPEQSEETLSDGSPKTFVTHRLLERG